MQLVKNLWVFVKFFEWKFTSYTSYENAFMCLRNKYNQKLSWYHIIGPLYFNSCNPKTKAAQYQEIWLENEIDHHPSIKNWKYKPSHLRDELESKHQCFPTMKKRNYWVLETDSIA